MRLIGVKTGFGDSFIRKNLKENTWYPFGMYTEPTEGNGWVWQTDEQRGNDAACTRMYQALAEDPNESLSITVNSIVGKNGSGKSSLLDLVYRIINNFSYYLIDKSWEDNTPDRNPQRGHNLSEAKEFEATLFFETDGVLGSIQYCYGNVTYNYHSSAEDAQFENERIQGVFSKSKLERLTRHFFYTICTNYSIHALNDLDYVPNKLLLGLANPNINGDWLKGIFHKNDGYVVPITMVPYRTQNGCIDIANENCLAKQRLATLAVLFASQNKKFLGEYTPVSILYRFNQNAKKDYNQRFNTLYRKRFPKDKKCTALKTGLKKHWLQTIKGHYREGYESVPKEVQEALLMYLTYKTLKTCILYRKYGDLLGIEELPMSETSHNATKGYTLTWDEFKLVEVVKEMVFQDTIVHVNQKVQQVLNYLKRKPYRTDNLGIPGELSDQREQIEAWTTYGWSKMPVSMLYTKEVEGKAVRKPFQTYDEAYQFMPPAIFEWEISFTKGESKEEETLSQMSSGERQLMHSCSYIIYHIKNIESVTEGKYRVKYHNISLIFDEAELYYHPEYQRSFISNLIKILSWCHINHNVIRGVNILVATHSPFVLSDIPLVNTSYLEDGSSIEKKKETFCGNVHELLGGNFFMRYSIGDVARENVEEIVRLYHRCRAGENLDRCKNDYLANAKRYRYVADTIADQYLHSRIKSMVEEMSLMFDEPSSGLTLAEEIAVTRKRLQMLELRQKQSDNQ